MCLGAATAVAGVKQTSPEPAHEELTFSFVVNGAFDGVAGPIPRSRPDGQMATGVPEFTVGTVVDSDEVLAVLSTSQGGEGAVGSSLFTDAELVALLENASTGELVPVKLADCPTLTFERSGTRPFEQSVRCGDDLYSYDVTRKGVEILVNGEPQYSYALKAGLYRLNGVVVAIR
ncbi:hypothetical protein CH339_16050 [Rhodobium orientis]|uniref:Uncharacterized protein n=1 Tax=Rhodobium orientis TaxID=34017 RepID=A0A327JHT4_9HYPH|nr:hypothetical protein [Rhodobium orientis]RAI25950.1 hypothetical protein CH339_16050 [Rhodobium orientis]